MIFGIDPGLMGGIGWIDGDDVGAATMPILNGKIDLQGLHALYVALNPSRVIIELAGVRPGQGGSGGLTIGINWGLIVGQIMERGIPLDIVSPSVWKKSLGLIKRDKNETPKQTKERSVQLAVQLFPSVDMRRTPKCKTRSDGMAEALLLAEFGRRKFQ